MNNETNATLSENTEVKPPNVMGGAAGSAAPNIPLNVLSPAEYEAAKTEAQRAEDIAYTINHSVYCTITDFINPPVNAATDGYLRWLIPGCGHDHSGDHAHDHGHNHGPTCNHDHGSHSQSHGSGHVHSASCNHGHAHGHGQGHAHGTVPKSRWDRVKLASKQAFSKERFIQYVKGEFIGDFGAVPLTIATQRTFPTAMDGLRKLSEPIIGPVFQWGVERSSKKWALQKGIDLDSPEYKTHVKDVYEHEMRHFPQAIAWTGYSLGLNVAYQMHADKSPIPTWNKLALKTGTVLSGILITAGVVVAARALAPHKMREIDKWSSDKVILPVTKGVSKVFGVDENAVDRMVENQEKLDHGNWAERVGGAKRVDALPIKRDPLQPDAQQPVLGV